MARAPGGRALADGPRAGRLRPGCPYQQTVRREAATLAFDPRVGGRHLP
jgi:hypothetical protein